MSGQIGLITTTPVPLARQNSLWLLVRRQPKEDAEALFVSKVSKFQGVRVARGETENRKVRL